MNNKIKISIIFTYILIGSTFTFSNATIIKTIDQNNNVISDKTILLDEIQNLILVNNNSWNADYTPLSNISKNEKQILLGVKQDNKNKDFDEDNKLTTSNIPDQFDWRNIDGKDWTTNIKNQKNCGSCVAFGVIAALESIVQIYSNNTFGCDLSEAHLFFCGQGSCNRGWIPSEALERLETYGVPDEKCFPYRPWDMDCSNACYNWEDKVVKISYSYSITGENSIKDKLINYGPLVTTMDVYEDFFYYDSGIYEHVYGERLGGHCVTIVGYNENPGYWICKNSWGSYWGEQGWFNIKYGQCKIDRKAYFMNLPTNQEPNVPDKPSGTNSGKVGKIYTFNTSSSDPNHNGLYYIFNWGDETTSGKLGVYPEGEMITASHSWSTEDKETFQIKVKAFDVYGFESNWSPIHNITIINNPPYKPSKPQGASKLQINKKYSFKSSVNEPDDDLIYYLYSWGDGNATGWIGPKYPDADLSASHIWTSKGNYSISIKVKDEHGAESEWSESLTVSTSKTKIIHDNIFFNRIINFSQSLIKNI